MSKLVVRQRLASSVYRSYEEYLRHPIFRACVKARIRMCGGLCEDCGDTGLLQPHHEKYPAWGSFDTPSNIRMLCHECHCRRHDKEQ